MTTYQHLLSGTVAGHTYEMSIHTDNSSGTLPGAHAAWVSAVNTLWDGSAPPPTSFGALVPAEAVPEIATTYSIEDGSTRKVAVERSGVTFSGSATGERLPPFTCAVLNLRGFEIGRHNLGKVYQPPMTITHLSSSGIDATAVGRMLDNWQLALQSLAAAFYTPVIFNVGLIGITQIATIDMRDKWAVQRRRQGSLASTSTSRTL